MIKYTQHHTMIGIASCRSLLLGVLVTAAVWAGSPDRATDTQSLTVNVLNIKSDTGAIRFALFDCTVATSWDDSVCMAQVLFPNNRQCTWITPPLSCGRYALAVFHDCNLNTKLDKNRLLIPIEPYGFSNNVTKQIGPPTIKQATFLFDSAHAIVSIIVR
jgi:uncharacterized protein (DUF2141 family)